MGCVINIKNTGYGYFIGTISVFAMSYSFLFRIFVGFKFSVDLRELKVISEKSVIFLRWGKKNKVKRSSDKNVLLKRFSYEVKGKSEFFLEKFCYWFFVVLFYFLNRCLFSF